MDELQELLSSILLTEAQVFAQLDEYSALVHYLGFPVELRKAYSSPFRSDEKPSFGVFERTKGRESILEYMWKDSALNVSGDIVDLVRRLYHLSSREAALLQIDQEFELGLSTSTPSTPTQYVYQKPPSKTASQILVRSCPFTTEGAAYWQSYGVSAELLRKYDVRQVSAFWTQPQQEAPFTPKGLCFSYCINGFYKLYQPFNKEFKFINNFPENYVEGFLQLPEKGELCLITKSTKDCMVLHSLGYSACSPRSESTPFPPHLLQQLRTRFSRVVTFFDNDYGKEQNWGQMGAAKYGLPNIMVPDCYAQQGWKDISDVRKQHGHAHTQQLLTHLLDETRRL